MISNKSNKLFVLHDKTWKPADVLEEEEYGPKLLRRPTLPPLATLYGFITFDEKEKYKVFKIKDTTNPKNKGTRCDQAGKKKILSTFNYLLTPSEYEVRISTGKGKKLIEWCIWQEFLLRHYQAIHKDGKTWFLSQITP